MRECKQKNCTFLIMKSGCKICGDCSAAPFIIADDCIRCYECENIPGSCRWDDGRRTLIEEEEKNKKKIKVKDKKKKKEKKKEIEMEIVA